jgi:hypothetical protein
MVISADGAGERSLFVSYISEAPVWKATYRIVLDPKRGKEPLLQGWAIVDNVIGQDWENVQLSLVAGAPQSFIQNLSQPYYSRRPVVGLPESVNMAPQTHQATLIPGGSMLAGRVTDPGGAGIAGATVRAVDGNGNTVGETTSDASGVYNFPSLPAGRVRLEASAVGFAHAAVAGLQVGGGQLATQDVRMQVGTAAQTIDVSAEASTVQTSASMRTSRTTGSGGMLGGAGMGGNVFKAPPPAPPPPGLSAGVSATGYRATAAQDLGDLFEYKLKDPITIQKDRSALVPIAQGTIGAEKVSIWNERSGMARPERALWLTNTTGLTLDGGSFSVMEEDTFAGEGIFEPIRPKEKRLVSYAADLALIASSKIGSEHQRVTRARIAGGILIQEHEVRERKTYTFRNEDASPRTVIVEHPVRAGYELRSDIKPVETTPNAMRFSVSVPSKQTVALVVDEGRPIQNTVAITDLTGDQVDLYLQQRSIDGALADALRKVLAQKSVVDDLDSQKSALEDESEKIFDDQQRLRENMKALKGSPEEKALLQRYAQQLDAQENRLAALRKETQQLETRRQAAEVQLNKAIAEMSLDVKL